jgi:uncharacterized protein (TIGR03435 family)
MRRLAVALTVLLACGGAGAAAQLSFEVASIRPSTRTQPAPLPSSPDQLVRAGFTLLQLVQYAFDRHEFNVAGGPDWMNSARFDVTARAEKAVTLAEMRSMTRSLLEDRFALKTHTETRELDVFVIVLARKDGASGPQLKRASFDCTPFMTGARPMSESPRNERGTALCLSIAIIAADDGVVVTFRGSPIEPLARRLQGIVRRPVIDRTGLSGIYDVELKFTVDGAAVNREGYPALMTAMEEQLGLKLESRNEPVEVLVIDDAQPPTPN